MILMLRNFQFNALWRGSQRPNLPYKRALRDTFGWDSVYITCHWKLCHFSTEIFVSKHRYFSNNTFVFYKYLSRTSCNNTSSANKSRSYLHGIVCCCGLEFQFLSVPTHSRLPSRATRFIFYVPSPPSPLGYYTGTSRIRRRDATLSVLQFGSESWFLLSLFLYTQAGAGSVYTSSIWIRTALFAFLVSVYNWNNYSITHVARE